VLIAISGWGQPDDLRRSREAGFNHHLAKPAAQDLVETLLQGETPPMVPDAQRCIAETTKEQGAFRGPLTARCGISAQPGFEIPSIKIAAASSTLEEPKLAWTASSVALVTREIASGVYAIYPEDASAKNAAGMQRFQGLYCR
jgi:hypothetical protein